LFIELVKIGVISSQKNQVKPANNINPPKI
jgi:hypothetical protein